MVNNTPGESGRHRNDIVIQIRYLAAGQPLTDPRADRTETLAALKARALDHFGLVEGNVEGGSKQYSFSREGELLTDLSTTLGELAGDDRRVTLILLEQFIQG